VACLRRGDVTGAGGTADVRRMVTKQDRSNDAGGERKELSLVRKDQRERRIGGDADLHSPRGEGVKFGGEKLILLRRKPEGERAMALRIQRQR